MADTPLVTTGGAVVVRDGMPVVSSGTCNDCGCPPPGPGSPPPGCGSDNSCDTYCLGYYAFSRSACCDCPCPGRKDFPQGFRVSLVGAITFATGIFKGNPITDDFGDVLGRYYIKFIDPPTITWDGCDQSGGRGDLCSADYDFAEFTYEVYDNPDGTGDPLETLTTGVTLFATEQTQCCGSLIRVPCFPRDGQPGLNAFLDASRDDCTAGGMRAMLQTFARGPTSSFFQAEWLNPTDGVDNTVNGCSGGTVTYALKVGGDGQDNPITSGPVTFQMLPSCTDCAGHPFETPGDAPARCGSSMNFYIEIWDGTYDMSGNANYVIAMGVGLGTGGCGTWSYTDEDVSIQVQKYIGSSGDTDPDCCPPGDANDPTGPACNSNAAWQITIVGGRISGTALIRTACGFSCPPLINSGDSPGTILRDDIAMPDHGDTAGNPGWRNLAMSFNTDCPT